MKKPRRALAISGVAAAALAVAGTVGAFAAIPSKGVRPATASGPVAIHTVTAVVQGSPETILENANGMPLYIYQPDTPTDSKVTGQLAVLWPPLTGTSAVVAGAAGTTRTEMTANGSQVTYNGHFLYTFVQDTPGQVTGQGVQQFTVATPDLPNTASGPAGTSSAASSTPNYGY